MSATEALVFNEATKSYSKEQVADSARKISVEIGDSKQSDLFYPQVKILNWDNECNLSIRAVVDAASGISSLKEGVVEWESDKELIRIHDHNPYGAEDGGLEFSRILKERPESNVLHFTIQTKEFEFIYQGELTAEEIKRGAVRPDHVIGSYAVYHRTKAGNFTGGKEYRAGKAFHIYRPWVEDANGVRVWCALSVDVDTSLLSITVPQNFLDSARYPVLADPTIGYTSIGGSSTNIGGGDAIVATSFNGTPVSSGTVDSVSIYGHALSVASTFKGLIFPDSTKVILTNGITLPALMPSSVSPSDWTTAMFATPPSVSSGVPYYVGHINDTDCIVHFDSGSGFDEWFDNSNSYASPSNPTDGGGFPFKLSYYATYIASGGGGFIGSPMMAIIAGMGNV